MREIIRWLIMFRRCLWISWCQKESLGRVSSHQIYSAPPPHRVSRVWYSKFARPRYFSQRACL